MLIIKVKNYIKQIVKNVLHAYFILAKKIKKLCKIKIYCSTNYSLSHYIT